MYPKKPTALKVVQGTARKDRVNKNEPKPKPGCPKPSFLNGRAARIWKQYAPELERLGVLTSVDAHMFAAWCGLAAELEEGIEHMNATRLAQLRALSGMFGLDASSRARMSIKPDEQHRDEAETFLRQA